MPRIEIHTTDRMQFKRCRQRWDFQSNIRQNMETVSPIEPLWFGTGIHLALAEYYEPSTPRSASDAMEAYMAYCDRWYDGLPSPTIENDEFLKEMKDKGHAVLGNYFNFAVKNDRFDVLWVERVFEVDVPGMPGVSYNFRCDGLVQDEWSRLWILEHKTAASFPNDTEWLMLDDQVGSYIWGVNEVLDIFPEGVFYNVLRKKAPTRPAVLKNGNLSMNKAQDTTFEVYMEEVKKYYPTDAEGKVRVPKPVGDFLRYLRDEKPNNFVRREFIRRNRHEIQMLGEALRWEVMDMVNNPYIYRSPSRINCSGCQFIGPCIAKWEGSDWQSMLGLDFKSRTREDSDV